MVRGTGFSVNENVSITLDSTAIGSTKTNRTGTFSTGITIPSYVSPGKFVVQATGKTSGRSAQAIFLVQTTWNMFGDNARHSHFNPYENSIAPGNVVKLSNGSLFHIGSVIGSSPAVVNGVVYIGSGDGNVYAFNAKTGSKVWSSTIGSFIESSPTVANGLVYIGAQDDSLSILDASTGAKLWSAATGSPLSLQGISSSPTVVNGAVYIGSRDGNLYTFCMCG